MRSGIIDLDYWRRNDQVQTLILVFIAFVTMLIWWPFAEGQPRCEVPYAEASSSCISGEVLDDGTPESFLGVLSSITSETVVQKFTPRSYPWFYHEVCVAWSRSIAPGDTSIAYDLVFYDDDGPGGEPGSVLAMIPASVSNVPAVDDFVFSSTPVGITVTEGSVYIGFLYDPSVEQGFAYPIDSSPTTPQQVIRSSRDNGVSWIYTTSLGRAVFVRASATNQYAVAPVGREFNVGNSDDEEVPFGVPFSRLQQIYRGSDIGSRLISELRFRGAFGEGGAPFCPALFSDVTVTLSTTSMAVDGLSTVFSINSGANAVLVYDGDLRISSRGSGVPDPFDIRIPLQKQYYFDGGGNLLLDINLPNGSLPSFTFLDTHDAVDGVSRAYCSDVPGCNVGDTAQVTDSSGLVTLFLTTDPRIFADGFESFP